MNYYLIYLYKGIVVDVCRYDDCETQMSVFFKDSNKPDWEHHIRYDSIQIFNEVR